MKFTTKAMPTCGMQSVRHHWHCKSNGTQLTLPSDSQETCDEPDRVLAILAMGGNDVPPTLVRRAIDERWSVDKAAQAFRPRELAQIG